MRDEFPVEIIDVIDQPGLDETRKAVRNVEVLGALPEFLELFRQFAMLRQMGFDSGIGQESHQAFFHREMDPGLNRQFIEDGVCRVAILLVGRASEAVEQILEVTMLQVDFGNADLEFTESLIGVLAVHNRVATLRKIANASTMGNENSKLRVIRKLQVGWSGVPAE